MSEKRFLFKMKVNYIDEETGEEIYHYVITDTLKEKDYEFENVVGLLNTLHQENQQLKHYKLYEDNKRLQTIIADLKKENEQLKEELNNLKKDETMLYHYYTLARYGGDGV